MEKEESNNKNTDFVEYNQDPKLNEVLKEIEEINGKIEQFNTKINNTI